MNESESIGIWKKRGCVLSYLIPLMVFGAGLLSFLPWLNAASEKLLFPNMTTLQGLWIVGHNVLLILFLAAVWRWEKWGCFGFIALLVLNGLILGLAWGIRPFVLGITVLAALYTFAVYKEKKAYFN